MEKATVKLGNAFVIGNKQKKPSEANTFVAVYVEEENGKEDRCLLFTEKEYAKLSRIYCESFTSMFKAGRLYSVSSKSICSYFVLVNEYSPSTRTFTPLIKRIPLSALVKAENRAIKHPEDIPSRAFFSKLFDN